MSGVEGWGSGPGGARRAIVRFAGYPIAAACIAWVAHDIDLRDAARSAASMRWAWVPLAVLLDVGSYFCQGWRWEILLRRAGTPGVLRATQAVYSGLFANEVLPARLGEAVRAYLVRRWTGSPYTSIVSSMLLERFCDALWLAGGFALVAMFVPLPRDLMIAGDALGILVILATAVFVTLVLKRHREGPESGPGPRRAIGRLAAELRAVGGTRAFYAALLVSLGIPFLQGISLWVLLFGYGFGLSVWAGLAIFLIVHLGTALPNAPGNIGTYQLLCVVALRLFGVGKAPAAGFSVVAFVILTAPLWALGALALARSGTSLTAIRGDMSAGAVGPDRA